MTTPAPAFPRIFVSHAHHDNAFCRRLVHDLRAADADVWYDEHNLGGGELRREIDRELPTRPYFVVILSPDAVASDWVNREIDGALDLMREGAVRVFPPVVVRACEVPATLRGFRRVDYTAGEASAEAALFHAVGMRSSLVPPATETPVQSATAHERARDKPPPPIPPERFPRRLADLGFEPRNEGGVEVIVPPVREVSAGAFPMGSDPRRDKKANDGEKPQHSVTLSAYRIATHPVTVAEYDCFVRAMRRQPQNWQSQLAKLDHPVVSVTWNDAVAYAAWLARVSGQAWRLPTEAEWEKAARGTDGRIYPWGDAFDKTRCNTRESGIVATTPVGTYPSGASSYGAHDMAGNVWEWTSSLYKPYPYVADDGREAVTSDAQRVLRGGSWLGYPLARAAFRYHPLSADVTDGDRGFRVAVAAAPGS